MDTSGTGWSRWCSGVARSGGSGGGDERGGEAGCARANQRRPMERACRGRSACRAAETTEQFFDAHPVVYYGLDFSLQQEPHARLTHANGTRNKVQRRPNGL